MNFAVIILRGLRKLYRGRRSVFNYTRLILRSFAVVDLKGLSARMNAHVLLVKLTASRKPRCPPYDIERVQVGDMFCGRDARETTGARGTFLTRTGRIRH